LETNSQSLEHSIAKGRLMSLYEIRAANFELAKAGSSPAIAKFLELMEKSILADELKI
jgi:hypothetical protein